MTWSKHLLLDTISMLHLKYTEELILIITIKSNKTNIKQIKINLYAFRGTCIEAKGKINHKVINKSQNLNKMVTFVVIKLTSILGLKFSI